MPNEVEMNLSNRKAVFKPFPQAVPNVFSITKRGTSPCKDSCPAHIGVQAYVQLVKLGKFDEALAVIHEITSFAGTLGRICPHPCEDVCMRGKVEDPVAIAALKRAAYDFGKHVPEINAGKTERKKRSKKTVAVIGAGPAGLAAAYSLAKKGYPVTVFEKLPVTGGMLRVGVPEYRLPAEVLESEVDIVRNLGVKIKTSTPVKGSKGIRGIFKKGFKAVFIATGTHKSINLKIRGEKLRGVVHAVDFLRRVNVGQKVSVGKRIVVVGGGNAAIDASRTLLRLGARKVTILYRRTRNEMPASSFEVNAALDEGIQIEFLAAPIRITGNKGRVSGIEAIRTRLGEPDSSGRRRPVPIEGSGFQITCDMLVPAIGQAPELDFIGKTSRLKTTLWGTIVTDENTCATNLRGVFAGGDVVSGPATAIEAIEAGNRAAKAIHCFLEGKKVTVEYDAPPVVNLGDEELESVNENRRISMPELSGQKRRKSFLEVEKGFKRTAAAQEADRCLNCAGCSDCLECERVCQAKAVLHGQSDTIESLKVKAVVLATGFNTMDTSVLDEYGAGKIANVVSGLEFERLLSASGPTSGHVQRPSDSKAPKKIAFIQCVGSRDIRNHAYCSAVCCMHATKEAVLANEHDRQVSSTIFYTDLRAAGKTFQEYVARARKEYSVSYVRSRPGLLEEDETTGDVRVQYEDTTTRRQRNEAFDLVVLCQALIPAAKIEEARALGVELNEHGFIHIPDVLSAPVDTTRPGVLAVGFATGPQDIPESVVQATAAAGRVAELVRG
jgi:NADPH-dependent glutamate synthase beta subunit-like oxidoreductase